MGLAKSLMGAFTTCYQRQSSILGIPLPANRDPCVSAAAALPLAVGVWVLGQLPAQALPVVWSSGADVYRVTAPTADVKQAISRHHLGYVCGEVVNVLYADFYRGDCRFAEDVEVENGQISFRAIDGATVKSLGLQPSFTLWQRLGRWVMGSALAIFAFGWGVALFSKPSLQDVSLSPPVDASRKGARNS